MGSIGVAIYRGQLAERLPDSVPAAVAEAARDTLGSATAVAAQLPDELGAAVLQAAREAFVAGMRLSSALAVLTLVVLRNEEPASPEQDEDLEAGPVGSPAGADAERVRS